MKNIYYSICSMIILLSISPVNPCFAGIFSGKTDSIQIVFDKNQLVLPGETFKIGVISYHKNGKIKKSFGLKGGSVLWWKYNTKVVGGSNSSGKITVNPQLLPSKGKYISVTVSPRKKTHLAKTILIPLNYETQISFHPTSEFDKAPGCIFEGEIVSEFNNGIIRKYKLTRWNREADNFEILTAGLYYKKGKFTIEPDFTKIIDHHVDLQITSRLNPKISNHFLVLMDYKHEYNLSLSGSSGSSGFDGSNGSGGASGTNGQDGQHGEDGSPGYDGPDINVWTDVYFDSTLNCNLLYVFAENIQTGEEYKYLINPDGGKLQLTSRGGDGGNGGDGGDGGDGGRGADGQIWFETRTEIRIVSKPFTETITKTVKKTITNSEGETEEIEEEVTENITVYRDVEEKYEVSIKHQDPGENGGDGGYGGHGGYGAPAGFGGNLFLYFTDDAWAFEDKIVAQSIGGFGGNAGDGGSGGNGGSGGDGAPCGRNGSVGNGGFSGFNGSSGGSGWISKDSTEEFFFYEPIANLHY